MARVGGWRVRTAQAHNAYTWFQQQGEQGSPPVRASPPWPDVTHGQPLLRCAQHRAARDRVQAL